VKIFCSRKKDPILIEFRPALTLPTIINTNNWRRNTAWKWMKPNIPGKSCCWTEFEILPPQHRMLMKVVWWTYTKCRRRLSFIWRSWSVSDLEACCFINIFSFHVIRINKDSKPVKIQYLWRDVVEGFSAKKKY
jgi:hypothetical protein